MPNLPASIGRGITVAYANQNVSAAEKETAASLLCAVGEVLWVEQEDLLNPVTALSGSGPAYIFLLIEAMTKAGIHIGLDPVMAEKLARQTVIGSAALAEASPDISAQQLRQNVTSPGGTTQAALEVLMAQPGGIQDIFNRALAAAAKRAEELSG
jgi:pyrroline-5-carboxylate reductase